MDGGWFAKSGPATRTALRSPSATADILWREIDRKSDFVLLDEQSSGRAALFSQPRRVFRADTQRDLPAAIDRVRSALADGATLVGYLSYAAGAAFDTLGFADADRMVSAGPPPLLWLAEFDRRQDVALGPAAPPVDPVAIEPFITRKRYEGMVASGLDHIRRGDIYQINLTFPATFPLAEPVAFYAATRQRARAPFGAFVQTDGRHILSFSPELFFRLEDSVVTSRPMKGTRPRGSTPTADKGLRRALLTSAKDRAENLMIVDLIRNDLARVCESGSVRVPRLFDIEAYPTVWQMTSTVTGQLRSGGTPLDIIAALFPCGSITGAPKIMASRIIAELEIAGRGIYTGSILFMSKDKAAASVAIRTIDLVDGIARLDLGAGIVADSQPRAEWTECLAKARFATG